MASPPYLYNGWQTITRGFMDLLNVGVGIRKSITKETELISYIDLSPADLKFASPAYSPCFQFHIGFIFNTKSKK
jgi:hypothetical protein